jgi:glycosyltransferase involved in cell wall biosynthesis
MNKIDFIIVIYKNYDLAYLQIKAFEKHFSYEDYNLIFIDNTPQGQRKNHGIDNIYSHENKYNFDGASHGSAIDFGLSKATSEWVCIMDSDFFLFKDSLKIANEKISKGFYSFGADFFDGRDTIKYVKKHPEKFNNIPCAYCLFTKRDEARKVSFKISRIQVRLANITGSSYIETGYKFRKRILKHNHLTCTFKGVSKTHGDVYHYDGEKLFGFHLLAGSHRNNNVESIAKINEILELS